MNHHTINKNSMLRVTLSKQGSQPPTAGARKDTASLKLCNSRYVFATRSPTTKVATGYLGCGQQSIKNQKILKIAIVFVDFWGFHFFNLIKKTSRGGAPAEKYPQKWNLRTT